MEIYIQEVAAVAFVPGLSPAVRCGIRDLSAATPLLFDPATKCLT